MMNKKELKEPVKRSFCINLYERDANPRKTFRRLKYSYDYSTICSIVDSFSTRKTFDRYIYGASLPQSIDEIANAKWLSGSDDLKAEINWLLVSIRKYTREINSFLSYKYEYEASLFSGEYDIAEKILDKIESEICFSLWGIENRFLLIELRRGLKENANYLKKINTNNRSDIVNQFAYFFSIKAEKELSIARYNDAIKKFLSPAIDKEWLGDVEFYHFYLSPDFFDFKKIPAILSIINNFTSIIDKYLALIRVFQLVITRKPSEDIKAFISSRLLYLSKKISNNKDISILLSIVQGNDAYNIDCTDKECIDILDLYIQEKYNQCQIALEKILTTKPLIFELYPIYIKALLMQDKKLDNWAKKDSFQHFLLENLYGIYEKKHQPADFSVAIKRMAYNLSSISKFSYVFLSIIKEEVDNDYEFHNLSIINSSFMSPRIAELINNPNSFYFRLKEWFPKSSLILSKCETKSTFLKQYRCYSLNKKIFIEAKTLQEQKKYDEAIPRWEILEKETLPTFLKERVLMNLFFCKKESGDLDYCICLFVKYALQNKFIVNRLKAEDIKGRIIKSKYKNITYSIDLPIFFHLINSESYETHIAYECFMSSLDIETPRQFIQKIKSISPKEIFFLEYVCSLEILKHSIYVMSTHDKYTERIDVCKFLMNKSEAGRQKYQQEANDLEKQLIIQKGLQEVDESKIFVNMEYIIQSELKGLDSVYNRYIAIKDLKKDGEVSIINIQAENIFRYSLQGEEQGKSELSKDPQYDIFKEIFYEVREKFLFGKQGLKMYLSARIRHGVLVGEIRPEFELLNLITEREASSKKYKDNTYWSKNIQQAALSDFNEMMSDFSNKIDSIINDELLDKFLLIRIENENQEGWFNYEFSHPELLLYYLNVQNISEYREFINAILGFLWKRTHENLWAVQKNIREIIKQDFFKVIQDLERNIQKFFDSADFFNAIAEVRVKIENKLEKISNWFTITNTQISDFQIEKIIEVCRESMNRNYTSKRFVLKTDMQFGRMLQGKYYTHFVDLLRIFFQNILDYAEEGEVKAFLKAYEQENDLIIEITNPLKQNEDIESLKQKAIFSEDAHQAQRDKSSGLSKAYNIVKNNFMNDNNNYKIDITDNEFRVKISISLNNIQV